MLKAGDILISRGSGTRAFVGRASLVQKVFEPTIFPDTAYRLRLDQTRVLPEWFVAVWNAPATRRAFEARIRTTAGIWKVAWKDLAEVTLAVPPPAEQADALEALHAATGRLDLALTKCDRGLRAIERHEQTMLRRAFEGHLIAVLAQDEDAALIAARAQQQPARTKRTARKSQMPNPREAFQKMVAQWPEAGLSFGEVRDMLPGLYEDLKEVVFEVIDRGLIKQYFDFERCAMILLRRTS